MRENWEIHWKDYYEILQIHPQAEFDVVKVAYLKLAQKYHSDHGSGGDQRMKDLNEANEIISDPSKRTRYYSEWVLREGRNGPERQAPPYPPQQPKSGTAPPPPPNPPPPPPSVITIKCGKKLCSRYNKDTIMKLSFMDKKPAFATCPVCKTAWDIRPKADRMRNDKSNKEEEEHLHWDSKPFKKRRK